MPAESDEEEQNLPLHAVMLHDKEGEIVRG